MEKFTVEAECDRCGGSGLYSGMCEGKAVAVVCHGCSGTGKTMLKVSWIPFTGKKARRGIEKVFKSNCGFGLAESTPGGMPFSDWAGGKPWPRRGHEIRTLACPAWYYQTEDYARKPEWDECGIGGCFSDCDKFKNRASCWDRFDREKL